MAEQPILSKVYKYYDDIVWVNNNVDNLYLNIKDSKSLDFVVDSLLLSCPFLVEQGDLRRRANIAKQVTRKMQKQIMPKSDSIIQSYMFNPGAAQRAKPHKQYSQQLDQREMPKTCFELFVTQIVDQNLEELQPLLQCGLLLSSRDVI